MEQRAEALVKGAAPEKPLALLRPRARPGRPMQGPPPRPGEGRCGAGPSAAGEAAWFGLAWSGMGSG